MQKFYYPTKFGVVCTETCNNEENECDYEAKIGSTFCKYQCKNAKGHGADDGKRFIYCGDFRNNLPDEQKV